jgi:hypothetical protein
MWRSQRSHVWSPHLPGTRNLQITIHEAVPVRPVLHVDLPVRGSDLVLNGSARFGATPNPELDRWSGSAPTPKPQTKLGPVQEGSGPDQSSELNCGNPKHEKMSDRM